MRYFKVFDVHCDESDGVANVAMCFATTSIADIDEAIGMLQEAREQMKQYRSEETLNGERDRSKTKRESDTGCINTTNL